MTFRRDRVFDAASALYRQGRHYRFLLRRRRGECGGGRLSRTGGCGAVLRSSAASEEVERIQAPLLLHYAELDTRINEGWPEYEAALKAAGKHYEARIYPGVNHGFHNDSTPRYDRKAAELAWDRTIARFHRYLA